MNSDSSLVALLLTNRISTLEEGPLTAIQYWDIASRIEDVGQLMGRSAESIHVDLGIEMSRAEQIARLLEGSLSFSFERERLEESGVQLLSCFDEGFPLRLCQVLGRRSPVCVLVAGECSVLESQMRGIVGSRNAGPDAADVAGEAARRAVQRGDIVVSGLARGVDQIAMAAALEAGSSIVGVPSEGLRRISSQRDFRGLVHDGRLCLISPLGPDVPFSVGNAMARNKIVYGLSSSTLVVVSDKGKGGTWEGAREALKENFAQVDVWAGPGKAEGNDGLIQLGARAIPEFGELWEVDFQVRPAETVQGSLFD